MSSLLSRPWPWWLAGPAIGLMVPLLLVLGNKLFGVSSNLRHLCAALCPPDARVEYFRYDWRRSGGWNLAFAAGVLIGGWVAGSWLAGPSPAISPATQAALAHLGLTTGVGLAPPELFSWRALLTLRGFVAVVVGGFLVGFGTQYAGGCTSGHGIAGLADFQLPSLIAVLGFFAGGLLCTYLVLPWLLG
jgi:uncharacterized membrane protein YedE/YeeE